MKIALLLTGYTRTYDICYDQLKNTLLDKYDVDIYFSTWNKTESRLGEQLYPIDEQRLIDFYGDKLKGYVIKDINTEVSPTIFMDRSDDVFKVNQRAIEHSGVWIKRLKRQWYLVNEGLKLTDYRKYDKILRLRFDLLLNDITIKDNDFVIPKDIGGWSYSDHMAYGNVDSMTKYMSLYEHIDTLYEKHNVDITHAVDMVKFYMEDYWKIQTYTDNTINYRLEK